MGEESPVQNNRRKVPAKQNDENEIEVDMEEHKNEVDERNLKNSVNHNRQTEWNLMIALKHTESNLYVIWSIFFSIFFKL